MKEHGNGMARLSILVAVQRDRVEHYRLHLSRQENMKIVAVASEEKVRDILAAPEFAFDVLVLDATLCDTTELLRDIQRSHPALLTVLIDEGADFAMPGRAHDISTAPFENDDLVRRIKRLVEERRLETLRTDTLPPVRAFAREIRKAAGTMGKQEAAVKAIKQLEFDYVGYFSLDSTVDPPTLSATSQLGPPRVIRAMPPQQPLDGLLGWVATKGLTRVVGPDDEITHKLVSDGVYASAVCAPVGINLRFGLLLACRKDANAIGAQDVMMLELVAAQLAAALAAETRENKKS